MIPAVAGARYFLCVAKESNQRKATAGLANRGAGQEPKRTVCGTRIRGRGSAVPVSQSEPVRDKGPSRPVSYLRPAVANTCTKLVVHCKCQVTQTCVPEVRCSSQNSRQNRHACARILIRRVKVGDEAGRVFGRAWLRLNHGHRGAAWRMVIPQTVRFGS